METTTKRNVYSSDNSKGFNLYGVKRCESPLGCCNTINQDGYLYSSGKYCSLECQTDGRTEQMKAYHRKGYFANSHINRKKNKLAKIFIVRPYKDD